MPKKCHVSTLHQVASAAIKGVADNQLPGIELDTLFMQTSGRGDILKIMFYFEG